MAAQIEFAIVQANDGSRLGKIRIPYRKSADWINFLVSPRQGVRMLEAENHRSGLILYFQANDQLYIYLEQKLTNQPASKAQEPIPAAVGS